jgi:hypothetical protein
MARRNSKAAPPRAADELVPRLRAAVKVVDEAISKLARTGTRSARHPKPHGRRG